MSFRARLPFIAFYFVYFLARGISTLIIPLYFVDVGIPILFIGVALAVNGLSILFSELLWGLVLDRVGGSRLIPVVVLLTIITYITFPLTKTASGAIGIEILYGVAAPALTLIVRSSVITQSEAAGWAQGFGVVGLTYSVAVMIGSVLGASAVGLVGFIDSFYLVAGVVLVAFLVYNVWRGRYVGVVVVRQDLQSENQRMKQRLEWFDLAILSIVAIPLFMGLTFFTGIMQVVVTKTPAIHATTFDAGILIAIFYLSTTLFQPIFSRLGSGRARAWIAAALFCNFLVFVAMTFSYEIWLIYVLAFAEGACYSAISPLSLSLLMVRIPKRYVGTAMGIYGAAEDIGVILGPLVGTFFWVRFGLTDAYLSIGIPYLVALLLFGASLLRGGPRPRDNIPLTGPEGSNEPSRIHRPGHHGSADVSESDESRLSAHGLQQKPRSDATARLDGG